MIKFLRFGLSAFAVTFLFNAFAVTETKAQGALNEILNRMDVHYKALKTLQADITRVQHNSQLDESDVLSGTISLIPGKGRNFSLRLDWKKPKEEIMSVVNGKYVAYIPNIKRAYTGSSDSKMAKDKGGNILQVMSMSKQELKTKYNIQFLGQVTVSGNIPAWHLKLTPKTSASYKFAELWVDGNGMPIQGKVTSLNNDTDSALLRNLQKNVGINASIFKVNLPKGTNIVEG